MGINVVGSLATVAITGCVLLEGRSLSKSFLRLLIRRLSSTLGFVLFVAVANRRCVTECFPTILRFASLRTMLLFSLGGVIFHITKMAQESKKRKFDQIQETKLKCTLLEALPNFPIEVVGICEDYCNVPMLATATNDGATSTIQIWNLNTFKCVRTLIGEVDCMSWNGDQTKLVTCKFNVTIWDVLRGTKIKTILTKNSFVTSVSWHSSSDKIAIGFYDNTIEIWDVETVKLLNTLFGHSKSVWTVDWNKDGTKIASGSHDSVVKIWDVSTGQCLQTLSGHTLWINSVAWNCDNTLLASCSAGGTVKIWDTLSWTCIKTLDECNNIISSLSWNHLGSSIVFTSTGATICIYDMVTEQRIKMKRLISNFFYDEIRTILWRGNYIVSGSRGKHIPIWDATTGQHIKTLELLFNHCSFVTCIA